MKQFLVFAILMAIIAAPFIGTDLLAQPMRANKQIGQFILSEPVYVAPKVSEKEKIEGKNRRVKQIQDEMKKIHADAKKLKKGDESSKDAKMIDVQLKILERNLTSERSQSTKASVQQELKADAEIFEKGRSTYRYVFEWIDNANKSLQSKFGHDPKKPVIEIASVKIKHYGARAGDFTWVSVSPDTNKVFYVGLVDSLEQVLIECNLQKMSAKNTSFLKLRMTLFPQVGAINIYEGGNGSKIINGKTNTEQIIVADGDSKQTTIDSESKGGLIDYIENLLDPKPH